MALIETVKKAIWLRGLLNELRVGQKQIFIYFDSQSAICLAKNSVFHVRTKHIDVCYQFVQEIISEGQILLQKIEHIENPIDILTKVVALIKCNHCFILSTLLKFDYVVERIWRRYSFC